MFSKVFGSVEVMSALILGFATIGAAALNLAQEAKKAKRAAKESAPTRGWLRRPLIVMTLALVVAAGGFIYATDSLQASTFARRILPHAGHKLINRKDADTTAAHLAPAPRPVAVTTAPTVQPEAKPLMKKASGELEDWLQAEGTKIYYRYTKYLPDACPGTPVAIGNWSDGEARPVPARCIDGGWIALDLGPLVQEGRIVPNMTYCMNFRAANGAWGIHVPENAPGVDSVAVPAVKVPLGKAIGVRYLPGTPREMVLPTSDTPRAPC
jgi:hypothetical protein